MPLSANVVAIKDLSATANAGSLFGISYQIISGSLDEAHKYEVEKLRAAGVDGQRLRLLRKIAPPLVLRLTDTMSSAVDYFSFEANINKFQGRLVRLTIKHNGTTQIIQKMYCTDVRIVQRMPGEFVGFGGGTGTKGIQFDVELERI